MPHKTFFWFFFPSGLAMLLFIGLPIISSFFQSLHIEPEQILKLIDRFYSIGIFPDWWKIEPIQSNDFWNKAGNLIRKYDPYIQGIVVLGKNSKGQMAVTKITLHPVVGFEGDFSIGDQEMKEMHDRSHRYCFVANSLSDEVGFEVVL